MTTAARDHGGGLDAAAARFGGHRRDWIDLSTGINPVPYPMRDTDLGDWTALPDRAAFDHLTRAARRFWSVPDTASVLPAPGASALIARIPALRYPAQVNIQTPTYNEHAAAFDAQGWQISQSGSSAQVMVHPNNPDGRLWTPDDILPPSGDRLVVIDESFCDVVPDRSMIEFAAKPGVIVLKSFGKFWGLAGLRLGFAIGDPALIEKLGTFIGPWAISGPALRIGARALNDDAWAQTARTRLAEDAERLDALMLRSGAGVVGGTTLFRLYDTQDAQAVQNKLAKAKIWSRIFPYSDRWVRLGLPAPDHWDRLEAAL